MPVRLPLLCGFFVVVLIWSTTPLAIKWSGEGPGYLFGVTARMLIGTLVMLVLARLRRVQVPWHPQARMTYLAAGLGIYGAMLAVYWGAQYINSGLISVIFGLTPIVTGVMAYFLLQERGLTPLRVTGVLFGLGGLVVIFARGIVLGELVAMGIGAVVVAVLMHALSSVLVKRWHADLPALSVTTGGLLLATPAYVVTWLIIDGELPQHIPATALWSIIYLGVIATGIGFTLYFYILRHMPASQVALLTLLAPVLALWIGKLFNQEAVGSNVWLGTALILAGMSIYQWASLWFLRRAK